MRYDTPIYMQMIVQNNLSAVHAALVAKGHLSASNPTGQAVASAIDTAYKNRLTEDGFLVWLESVLDVPYIPHEMYGMELKELYNYHGRSAASLMIEQIVEERESTNTVPNDNPQIATTPSFGVCFSCIAILGFALIGFAMVFGKIYDWLRK